MSDGLDGVRALVAALRRENDQLKAQLEQVRAACVEKNAALAELVSTWNEAHMAQKLLVYERGMRMASASLSNVHFS